MTTTTTILPPREVVIEPADIDVGSLLTHGAPDLAATVAPPLIARDPDGEIVLALADFGPGLEELRSACRGYPPGNTLRSSGVRNLSRSFGFVARNQILQRNACRACSGANESPPQHLALVNAATRLAGLAEAFYPDRFAADMTLVGDAVLPEWRMAPVGPWTSGVVNFDSPLPYHFDRNNFDVFSTMVTFRRGIIGGHLHCPQWQLPDGRPVVLPCGDGHVSMFNGQTLLHAVTPFSMLQSSSYRLSAVYYSVKRMRECLPFLEEIAYARRSRSDREDNWKANQEAM